jgi:long-chain acyl-CoA synthetase
MSQENDPVAPSAFSSIAEILPFHRRERGEKVALRFPPDGVMTYAALEEAARRFSAFLKLRGVGPGERVAILLPNVPEFVIAYFGAISAAAVAVPVNYRLSPSEIGYILTDCSVTALVTTGEQFAKVFPRKDCAGISNWVLIDGEEKGAVSFREAMDREAFPAPEESAPDDVAVLLYTSGTTGFPKGAMISHRNTLFNVDSCRATLGYREEDTGLINLPLFHVTALDSQLVALFACGASVVLQREYNTGEMLALISRYRVTALFFVPAIYKLITLRDDLDIYDLSSVRIAAYGGAPMDPETIRAIHRILPAELFNCYGLTECSSLGTVLPSRLALSRSDSVGLPVPGTQAQIRAPGGEALPSGEVGELFLKGPHIVQGYYGAPDKSREAIRDGWLKTGDIARIDRDGLVTILDRAKDMINRGGEKVYGLEVENVIYAVPGVAEAAVFGVPHPIFGEVPVATVVPMAGTVLDPETIKARCRDRLADYKVPVEVQFAGQLPRNPGGKVLKQRLKDQWASRRKEEVR